LITSNNKKMSNLSEKEINRIKYNYMKKKNSIVEEFNNMMLDLSKTTKQDMESKFDKKFELEEIEGYLRGIISRDWYDLEDILF
tara:strand:- start:275 stop:526 length:252 start_codon:yes stop_codon:yes gene_type:complete